jgi:hypothetical protein
MDDGMLDAGGSYSLTKGVHFKTAGSWIFRRKNGSFVCEQLVQYVLTYSSFLARCMYAHKWIVQEYEYCSKYSSDYSIRCLNSKQNKVFYLCIWITSAFRSYILYILRSRHSCVLDSGTWAARRRRLHTVTVLYIP